MGAEVSNAAIIEDAFLREVKRTDRAKALLLHRFTLLLQFFYFLGSKGCDTRVCFRLLGLGFFESMGSVAVEDYELALVILFLCINFRVDVV